MNGTEVFKFAIRIMVRTTNHLLEKTGLTKEDIDLIIPHQANSRIVDSAAKRLKLTPDKIMIDLDKYGNTSGGSIPIAMCEAAEQGRYHKGENVVIVGFGAGLTWASMIIKWQA